MSRRTRLYILCTVFAAGFLILAFLPPIPVSAGYHDFADHRRMLGLPNALDVLSNVPFLVVGIFGVVFLFREAYRLSFRTSYERLPYFVFFAGVALTGIGSAYYHLAPSNERLAWDLLPMTFCYAPLVAATIMERVSGRMGLVLLGPFMAAGAASVLYWGVGELHGHGDLRFYLYAQFFSAVAIGVTVLLFPPTYTGTTYLGVAFGLYLLAKVFEAVDKPIYSLGHLVSGHTLKHLTAGLACYWILRMLQVRHGLEREAAQPQTLQSPLNHLPSRPDLAESSGTSQPARGPRS
jgi:hypothetical protein